MIGGFFMKENLTELVFILDRSGSMGGLESDTIGGYNAMLSKQKNQSGRAKVTTVLFDDEYELIHERLDIEKVEPITEKQYFVRGTTALLDAIGKTLSLMISISKTVNKEAKSNKVIFVITTDGMENASVEYSYKKIKKMIVEMGGAFFEKNAAAMEQRLKECALDIHKQIDFYRKDYVEKMKVICPVGILGGIMISIMLI